MLKFYFAEKKSDMVVSYCQKITLRDTWDMFYNIFRSRIGIK
jgi:hypothetical protein